MSQTERALKVAKEAAEKAIDVLTLLGYDVVKTDRKLEPHMENFNTQSKEHNIATTLHPIIANFAYREVQQASATLRLDLYSQLARHLTPQELEAVQLALGIEVAFNLGG